MTLCCREEGSSLGSWSDFFGRLVPYFGGSYYVFEEAVFFLWDRLIGFKLFSVFFLAFFSRAITTFFPNSNYVQDSKINLERSHDQKLQVIERSSNCILIFTDKVCFLPQLWNQLWTLKLKLKLGLNSQRNWVLTLGSRWRNSNLNQYTILQTITHHVPHWLLYSNTIIASQNTLNYSVSKFLKTWNEINQENSFRMALRTD